MSAPDWAAIAGDQIAYVEERPPREAHFAEPRARMAPALVESLRQEGVDRLYTHQAAAYDAVMSGRDVMLTTGTNSGKSMAYHLPALQMALTEPLGKILYIFPTKALAQDQLGKITGLAPTGIRAGVYDGDTPKSLRATLRKTSHILITNPDMLHVGILPGHENWAKFLKSLRLIAIDEMHAYRGVLGSHVGNVIRRLLRLCAWHRSHPQIVGCSATIGNPEELFGTLTGRNCHLIDEDGSPNGRRTFVFWNPPLVDDQNRASANWTTSQIMAELVQHDQRVIAFSRARISAELVLRHARARLAQDDADPNWVESYRGGYTAQDRRRIEKSLFAGELRGLSSTNAMELGVDVGSLDAVVMNGYPGRISSFWQQAGRAGRGNRDGLAIMVAQNDPLEQWIMREPRTVLDAHHERVSANPGNAHVLAPHLLCAAHERPMSPSEVNEFGETALGVAESLDRSGELAYRDGLFFYPGFEPPALRTHIRSASSDTVRLLVEGEELGMMEFGRALSEAHAGAVYLHRGQSFLVDELNLEARVAHLHAEALPYYTTPIAQSVLDSRVEIARHDLLPIGLVGIRVTEKVLGYRQKSLDGEQIFGSYDLDLPPQTYETVGIRVDLSEFDPDSSPEPQIGGIHGLEHALMAIAPWFAGCDRGDIGSSWFTMAPDTFRPAVFIYDKTPGGIGLCERLFAEAESWIRGANALVTGCPCADGCPGCLLSPRCEVGNDALDKRMTGEYFAELLSNL